MTEEIRSVSSTGGEKGVKLEAYHLLPIDALATVARHYGIGAQKYADNQWRKGYEWSKSYAALQRHANQFWAGEDIDEETGSPHMAAVAWHALALLTFMDEHPDFDDRYQPAAVSSDVDPDTEELYRRALALGGSVNGPLEALNDQGEPQGELDSVQE